MIGFLMVFDAFRWEFIPCDLCNRTCSQNLVCLMPETKGRLTSRLWHRISPLVLAPMVFRDKQKGRANSSLFLSEFEGVAGSPGKGQKEGQEDEGEVQELVGPS